MNEKSYLTCKDPLKILHQWRKEAHTLPLNQPDAMILSTSNLKGLTSSRVVLLKEILKEGLLFYSNYKSLKGKNISQNPRASLLFYWDGLNRQVRINGRIKKSSKKKSKSYWEKRPKTSQLSQWISLQSETLKNRKTLEKEYAQAEIAFKNKKVPCPENWGGYILNPQSIEFWIFRSYRLHDRFYYKKRGQIWTCKRLYP